MDLDKDILSIMHPQEVEKYLKERWMARPIMYPSKEKIDVLIYDLARADIHEDEVDIVIQFIEDTHLEYIKKN